MKAIRLHIILILTLVFMMTLCACETTPALATPERTEIDTTTLTYSWGKVKDALLYTVRIEADGKEAQEFVTSKTQYDLAFLAEGTYKVSVKANGKGEELLDSPWSEAKTFIREREPGMAFTLIDNGNAYEVSSKGIATGDIVIPATYRNKPVIRIGDKAFFNKGDVTSVTIGENVTEIGKFAFANCSYLKSVQFPKNLTAIGESAFASCRLLEGVLTVPAGVTVIQPNTFAYCAKLTEVRLGDAVTSIAENAFADCAGLTVMNLPDALVSIGEYAFTGCAGLKTVTFGANLLEIGPYAFSEASALSAVTFPETLWSIGEGAFYQCAALQNVTLGSGIRNIALGAFQETALWNNTAENEVYVGKWFLGLKDVSVQPQPLKPDTIGIGSFAFYRNIYLVDVELPDSVKYIGEAAFAGASALLRIIIGSGVEEIGEQAFVGCKELQAVYLGSYDWDAGKITASNLKVIGSYAFRDCESLKEIEIPDRVQTIGSYAFRNSGIFKNTEGGVVYAGNWIVDFTEGLTGDIEVRDGTAGIANYAFYRCDGLSSITMPNTVKYVGRSAFYDCGGLTSVVLPDTLEVIEDYTFYQCNNLSLFTLPPLLKSIGRSAFYKCGTIYMGEDMMDGDQDVLVIPDSVVSIGDYAFYGSGLYEMDEDMTLTVYGIDEIRIGNGVKTIGRSAFYNFASLKRVIMGDSLESVGEKAFYRCPVLETVTFGKSVKTIGEKAFYKCPELKVVTISDSVTTIGNYAFYKCEALETLTLGKGVKEIGNFAFYGCRPVKELVLPTTIESIGRQAFRNCKGLTAVILPESLVNLAAHAFYGCPELTFFCVSDKAGENWDPLWNSSYRPAVWNCTLSENGDYVLYFEKSATSITNRNTSNKISNPVRHGYTCIGWDTNAAATKATYQTDKLTEATDGRKLYAIWTETVENNENN